jgi:tungstate transport system substrate-binding protein
MRLTFSVLLACVTSAGTIWPVLAERLTTSAVGEQPAGPVVRAAVVNTPDVLLTALLPAFEAESGYRVTLQITENVFDVARAGRADIVIAHFGHAGTEAFMTDGLGRWPRMVFSNQAVLAGPVADPVGIRGMADAVEAFRLMVRRGGEFVVNNAPTEKYLAEVLWDAIGRPAKAGWWLDLGLRDQTAVEVASARGAYTLWGLVPLVRLQADNRNLRLDAMVAQDPLLQRVMVSVVVNSARVQGASEAGALALQRYLLSPSTQAAIRRFRHHGLPYQTWWPAGRFNQGSELTPF